MHAMMETQHVWPQGGSPEQPKPQYRRTIVVDALRGWAILGIFLANLNGMNFYHPQQTTGGPWMLAPWDFYVYFLELVALEGKFYTLFSLLFGYGLALQAQQKRRVGQSSSAFLWRRMFYLLCIGLIHLLCWPGDILVLYALTGFLFLPLRHLSDQKLLILGFALLLMPVVLYAVAMHWSGINALAYQFFALGGQLDAKLTGFQSEAALHAYLRQADWKDLWLANLSGIFFRYGYLVFSYRMFKVLGIICLGYVLGRHQFFARFEQYQAKIRKVCIWGLVLGIPLNIGMAYFAIYAMEEYQGMQIEGLFYSLTYALGVVPLSLAYVGLMLFAFKTPWGKRIGQRLQPVGQMALTNYVSQTLVGIYVFTGVGAGLLHQVGPVFCLVLGLLFFGVQMVISAIWLKYFHFGPLEWLWRSASYGSWQPFLRSGHQGVTG